MTFYGLPKRPITLTGFQWSASALIKLIPTNKSSPKESAKNSLIANFNELYVKVCKNIALNLLCPSFLGGNCAAAASFTFWLSSNAFVLRLPAPVAPLTPAPVLSTKGEIQLCCRIEEKH